ncbi:MAG TPA: class I SAM-dependent methyltransferase [Gammaproteobacteria bacterium]|nr:class I SAM-dependent methyltransferase [Gammaproteobacteria bacterium]
MSSKTLPLSDALYQYMLSVSLREPDLARRLREETARMPGAGMQISPEQGQFMSLLIQLMGATRTLEIGVFTGYSTLCTALAMPDDGRVVACDLNKEWTSIAERYWHEAGVADKIDLRLGPAVDTLEMLLMDGRHGTFDFVFIDADKANYLNYYTRALDLVRRGGVIAIDNVFWGGAVCDSTASDPDTNAIRELNNTLHADARIALSMVPIGDGLTLAMKR